MASHLRNQATFAPFSAHITESSFPHTITARRPEKKQKMGLTQTYRLAHRARGKLSFEASRGDHDLRLLVGHANLLDTLMLELQEAEREQEAWFNQSVSVAASAPVSEPKRVQFVEEHRLDVPDASDEEEEEEAEDSDDSESEEEVKPTVAPHRQRARSPPAKMHTYEDDSEDEAMESDDDYDNMELSLTRTRSHSEQDMSVPELVHDNSDDSDDDSAPSSPGSDAMEVDVAQEHIVVRDFAVAAATQHQRQQKLQKEAADAMEEDGFYLPPREQQAPMVAAY